MKREQATREYLGISKNDSLVAAVDAYEWVESHPEEAPFLLRSALFDLHTASVQQNRELVSKAFQSYIKDKTQSVRQVIKKAAISKAANGGDIHDLVVLDEAIELISKANGDGQHSWEEKLHPRGTGGQFRSKGYKVTTDKKIPRLNEKDASARGIPPATGGNESKSRYQQAYLQVGQILRSNTPDDALIYGIYSKGKGDNKEDFRTPIMTVGEARAAHADSMNSRNGLVDSELFKNGYIKGVQVLESPSGAADNPTDLGYNLLGAAGAQSFSNINDGAFTNYLSTAGRDIQEPGTGERFYNQVNASSKLAQDVLGPSLGPQANTALFAAQFASQHAAEAEKVIGPKARKSAYRYRGVEKTPDASLQNTINETRNQERKKAHYTGASQQKADTTARNKIIYGSEGSSEPIDPRNPSLGSKKSPARESAIIDYFRKKLPNEELYVLNRESGNIPPSQGVIIDRKGQIVTEAMGYGDDWYLPFNLKNLSKLQGGEYIRTRAYGGLTAEDIYTGLVSGARAVTVVSHSGVYTVEFDDDFRGSKRYNDKAARMVGRYEHLLDSLASNVVRTAQRSQAREDEMKQEAAREVDPIEDPTAYDVALKNIRDRDDLDPQLAEADKDKIRHEVADNAAMKTGSYSSAADFAESKMNEIRSASIASMQRDPINASLIASNAERQVNDLSTAGGVLRALGAQSQAEIAVERAEEDYKMSHKPLRLNAQGYKKAQDALENQFPYYFNKVSYRPWNDGGAWNDDSGYVKPRYNRPEKARAGYHDISITGHGKRGADETGFQNLKVRDSVAAVRAAEKAKVEAENKDGTTISGGSKRRSNAGLSIPEQKQKAYYEVGKQLLDQYENGKFSSTDEPGGEVVRSAVAGKWNGGIDRDIEVDLDGKNIKDVLNENAADATKLKGTFPLFKDVSDLNDLESALADPNRRDKVMGAIDHAIGLALFRIKQESKDDLRDAKAGKLGAPKVVQRGTKNRRAQLDAFFEQNNSGANWEFGSGFDSKSAEDQVRDVSGVIGVVSDKYPDLSQEAAIDTAITAVSKDYKAAKEQASLAHNFDPHTNIKSSILGQTLDVLGRDGNPTPEFARNVEDLFKAKQAVSTLRKEQELQRQSSGNEEVVPEVVNNFAFINTDEDQTSSFLSHLGQAAGANDSPNPGIGRAAKQIESGDKSVKAMEDYFIENPDLAEKIPKTASKQEILDAIYKDIHEKRGQ